MPYLSPAARKVVFLCAFGVALLALGARAEGTSFRDDFDSFNPSRWIKCSHKQSEPTTFDPDNVIVDNGYLRLRIPADSTGGAEIESMNYHGYGYYRARMTPLRPSQAPSSTAAPTPSRK
ncbi:MAG TPA: glycoside hydrolase family 16 protein [Rubrobacter sp.]|nr:glycoside hydrolase family 16 protein [Rubrobacter sp.]